MKSEAKMKIDKRMYVTPMVKTVEVKAQGIICQSTWTGPQNEGYEEGNTEGWFGN